MNWDFHDFLPADGGVCAADGFTAGGIRCGIRPNHTKYDLAMIYSDCECTAAAVYTQNKVFGAPIQVTRAHLSSGQARAVIVNSGNANTGNPDGVEKAEAMCRLAAEQLHISPDQVIVASTGVIGQVLAIEPIADHIGELAAKLSKDGGADAAAAIMTTDTRKKEIAVRFRLGGKECVIGGMAKGSGMIHPNMATMLCFLTTDAAISAEMLDKALHMANEKSFNMVSIDGDTSTNDMVCIMASGCAGNSRIETENEDFATFTGTLFAVMRNLAKMVAADGEGATKLIECTVSHAPSEKIAKDVAKSVITSSLVKTAIFGADANWGRILCAIGYAEGNFDIHKIDIRLASKTKNVLVCKNGVGVDFSEEQANIILWGDEVKILVDMRDGECEATAWGCDLTYDYVKINGDYRT